MQIKSLFDRVAIIGFGEVGGIFARDLLAAGVGKVAAFDVAAPALARIHAPVAKCSSATEAARGAQLVILSVTAGSVLDAARSLEGGLGHGPYVLDVNSVSPATKQAAFRTLEAAGGRYVEAAVMTNVPPRGLASPMLLGGPHATTFLADAAGLALDATVFATAVGPASSVKMCRSIMVKGIEALLSECMLTARHYGVEQDVLRSLSDTLPHPDWPGKARYMISRALLHGRRRAEEMREVAQTVADAGVAPLLSRAIAERQDWAACQGAVMGPDAIGTPDLALLLDALVRASALGKAE